MPHKAVFLFSASECNDVIVGSFSERRCVGKIIIPRKFDLVRMIGDARRGKHYLSAVGIERQHQPESEGVKRIQNPVKYSLIAEFLPAQQSCIP